MLSMKPYQQIAIVECGEPLVAIPANFSLVSPHPYQKLGAPYGEKSPFYLRQGVVDRLLTAQKMLQKIYPGWQLQIFDAYRPVAVQQFMVNYTFLELVQSRSLDPASLTDEQRQEIFQQVYQFWAVPNLDPTMPPPHSTGAAIDITLIDELGDTIDLGSAIDEISERSHPNHFANSTDYKEQQYHQHRQLLEKVMLTSGFKQHWNEWWHFSYGDQIWAWLMGQDTSTRPLTAKYGRV
ncbi:M15 family metallopeptidase [Phormidesmis sp. 146-35]